MELQKTATPVLSFVTSIHENKNAMRRLNEILYCVGMKKIDWEAVLGHFDRYSSLIAEWREAALALNAYITTILPNAKFILEEFVECTNPLREQSIEKVCVTIQTGIERLNHGNVLHFINLKDSTLWPSEDMNQSVRQVLLPHESHINLDDDMEEEEDNSGGSMFDGDGNSAKIKKILEKSITTFEANWRLLNKGEMEYNVAIKALLHEAELDILEKYNRGQRKAFENNFNKLKHTAIGYNMMRIAQMCCDRLSFEKAQPINFDPDSNICLLKSSVSDACITLGQFPMLHPLLEEIERSVTIVPFLQVRLWEFKVKN